MSDVSAYERNLCDGGLSTLRNLADMGYLIGLRNLLPETTTRIQRANDEELSLQLAVMRRRRDEMEAYEDANGEGACMELEDPRMIELIELEAGRVTAEMITNACLARRKPGLSYH